MDVRLWEGLTTRSVTARLARTEVVWTGTENSFQTLHTHRQKGIQKRQSELRKHTASKRKG